MTKNEATNRAPEEPTPPAPPAPEPATYDFANLRIFVTLPNGEKVEVLGFESESSTRTEQIMPSIELTFTFEIGPFRGDVADITYGPYKIGRIETAGPELVVDIEDVLVGLHVQGGNYKEYLALKFSEAVYDTAKPLCWRFYPKYEAGDVPTVRFPRARLLEATREED